MARLSRRKRMKSYLIYALVVVFPVVYVFLANVALSMVNNRVKALYKGAEFYNYLIIICFAVLAACLIAMNNVIKKARSNMAASASLVVGIVPLLCMPMLAMTKDWFLFSDALLGMFGVVLGAYIFFLMRILYNINFTGKSKKEVQRY